MQKKKISILLILLIFFNLSNHQIAHQPEFLQQNTQQAEQLLNIMTLEEKIGQLFIASAVSDVERNKDFIQRKGYRLDPDYIQELIKKYKIGGVIFLGMGNSKDQVTLTQQFQNTSKIPLLICQDLEWGLSMRLDDALRFPRNMTLGALHNNNLIYQLGYEIGRQCTEIGVHCNFAPVVDVNNNPKNPVISDRSFGENKEKVAVKADYLYKGLHDAGVLSCIKHFPGHGDTDIDSHYALPYIPHDTQRLDTIELYPFKQLINAGVPAFMIAHLAVPALEHNPDLPTTLSHAVVTELLQKKLHFKGLTITDALDMKALSGMPAEIAVQAFKAGNDLLVCSKDIPAAIAHIQQQIEQNKISLDELNRRVLKILLAKQWAQQKTRNPLTTDQLDKRLHTPEAQQLKQALYTQSITCVKNCMNLSRIKKNAYIQIGGEEKKVTINQLGQDIEKIVPAQSTFKNFIKKQLQCPTYQLSNNPSKYECTKLVKKLNDIDTVIVALFDMNKFATKGYGLAENTLQLLKTIKTVNKKIIITLFGSPYSLTVFDDIDGIIMAYEDDNDAQQAAAEVVLGQRKASGSLPVNA